MLKMDPKRHHLKKTLFITIASFGIIHIRLKSLRDVLAQAQSSLDEKVQPSDDYFEKIVKFGI